MFGIKLNTYRPVFWEGPAAKVLMADDSHEAESARIQNLVLTSGCLFDPTACRAFQIAGITAASVVKLDEAGLTNWQILEEIHTLS